MTEHTDTTIRNAAAAVRDLANDIQYGGGSGSMGARIHATFGAVIGAANSIISLAEDLRGFHGGSGTTGENLRAALKRIGSKS